MSQLQLSLSQFCLIALQCPFLILLIKWHMLLIARKYDQLICFKGKMDTNNSMNNNQILIRKIFMLLFLINHLFSTRILASLAISIIYDTVILLDLRISPICLIISLATFKLPSNNNSKERVLR